MKKIVAISLLAILSIGIIFIIVDSNTLEKPKYVNIDLNKYQNKIDKKDDFIIYVYKTSCPVCQEMKPFINEAIQNENAKILALNTDEEGNLNRKFFEEQGLEKSPTILHYKNGIEKDRLEGFQSTQELTKFIKEHYDKKM